VRQALTPPDAARPFGAYSPAIRAGNLLFVSGQVPVDPATGTLIDGDIKAQTDQVMRNIATLLKSAGIGFEHVVKTTVFLTDMNEFAAMNERYSTFLPDPLPARSTIQVVRLPRDVKVEIDAIAVIP
jgi:2-iminobutanoate/2-iminopropanoate deaminase